MLVSRNIINNSNTSVKEESKIIGKYVSWILLETPSNVSTRLALEVFPGNDSIDCVSSTYNNCCKVVVEMGSYNTII
jgi:hypothetical protein